MEKLLVASILASWTLTGALCAALITCTGAACAMPRQSTESRSTAVSGTQLDARLEREWLGFLYEPDLDESHEYVLEAFDAWLDAGGKKTTFAPSTEKMIHKLMHEILTRDQADLRPTATTGDEWR